jgi:predicted ABC-type ATPase
MRDDVPESDEFFYRNADGERDDAALHNPILRAVEFPIYESIMGPIRAKHAAQRKADEAAQKRKATRTGDASVWNEEKHSRGQPKNKGQFGPGGGGEQPTQAEMNARAVAALRMGREAKKPEKVKGASNAAALYKAPTKTADEIVASFPGAVEAIQAAREQLKSAIPTNNLVSEGGYKLPDGTYTPGRAALHEKIVATFINEKNVAKYSPEPGQNPTLTILGGRGGSGKSWLSGKDGPIDTSKSMVVDTDEVKGMLPEYEGWNATQLHEESSDIVALIDRRAALLGLNVVLDGTLKSTNILSRIEEYQRPPATDYELEGYYMYASPETATTRALSRFSKGGTFSGRFVPPEVILGNTKNETNFDLLSKDFRKWAVYDNDAEGGKPKLYQRGGRRD